MREDIVMRKISPQDLEEIIELDVVNRGGHSVIDGTLGEETLFRLWAKSMDSQYHGLNSPSWIKENFKWGPHPWPISMTQILESRVADCGAFQDLATRVMKLRGVEAYAVQVFLQFQEYNTRGWKGLWESNGLDFHWGNTQKNIVYHELTGFIHPHKEKPISLYDPAEDLAEFHVSTQLKNSAMIGLRICSSYGEEAKNVGKKILLYDSNGKKHSGIEIDQWYHVFNNAQ